MDTLADRTYRALRDAITSGDLSPDEKVTERGLAERFAVSPTPVREAIRRLEQDGLLQRTGPRTVKVSALGITAIQELAEIEVGLRGMEARFAARHATSQALDQLDALLDETDDLIIVARERLRAGEDITRHLNRILDTMQRFNDGVTACAGNPVLARLLEQTRVFQRAEKRSRWLELAQKNAEFAIHRYESHRRLVQALRTGDEVAAEAVTIEDARGGLGDLIEDL